MSPDEKHNQPGASTLWPIAVSIAASVGILLIATVLILQLRANVGRRAQEASGNILRLVERDISRNVEVLDLALQAAVDGMRRPEVRAADLELRRLVLFDRSSRAAGIGGVVILDSEGRVSLASGDAPPLDYPTSGDRDYFNVHIAAEVGLHISRPFRSRALDTEVIGLSRRIVDPDGRFGGVALATMKLSYFQDALARLQLGFDGVVTLLRTDGAILMRQSARPAQRSEPVSRGMLDRLQAAGADGFTGRSEIDGVERLFTSSQVGTQPLIVVVGLATDDIYARFSRESFGIALVLVLICGGLIALTVRLTRELRRRTAAEQALTRTNADLARLSITDGLTGLRNRRDFDMSLARGLQQARRIGTKLTLLLIDVDHFKSFNDRYGHGAGDETLIAFGRVLALACRVPGSTAFRVGGEEFALLLPETGLQRGIRVAELIQREVRALARPHTGSPKGTVTASIGVAEIQDCEPAAAYSRADAALYRAKDGGRDRVAGAETPRKAA